MKYCGPVQKQEVYMIKLLLAKRNGTVVQTVLKVTETR